MNGPDGHAPLVYDKMPARPSIFLIERAGQGIAAPSQSLRAAAELCHEKRSVCWGCAQIEIGQLDDTIGISEVPFGNLTYWFQGSSVVLSIQLNQGMFFQPIGVYVNKTAPPRGPPSQQDSQARAHGHPPVLPPNNAMHYIFATMLRWLVHAVRIAFSA